jgi:hypothetical protein
MTDRPETERNRSRTGAFFDGWATDGWLGLIGEPVETPWLPVRGSRGARRQGASWTGHRPETVQAASEKSKFLHKL